MAYNAEAFQSLMEREGVSDFILTETWEDIPDTPIGIYSMVNDRWGCVFQIFPPFFANKTTEEKLVNFYKMNLPEKSSIQMFAFASRNVDNFIRAYDKVHQGIPDIENSDFLAEIRRNKVKWFKKHTEDSLFNNRGVDFRLRNFVNLCAVTIPKTSKNGEKLNKAEVINIFSRVASSLNDFAPKKFTQAEFVSLYREILVPDSNVINVHEDRLSSINSQVVDSDSVLTIDNHRRVLGLGKMISKEEFQTKMIHEDSTESNEEEYSVFSSITGLFKKKKKNIKMEAYTDWYAKTYTTKLYPQYNTLFSLLSKFVDFYGRQIELTVPCNYFSTLTIFIEEREAIKKDVIEKTSWNIWQTKALGPSGARLFPKIAQRGTEAVAINAVVSDGEMPMKAMWSVSLMDKSITKLEKYGENLIKEFGDKDWILQEETIIPHWIFLYSLPLQFDDALLMQHSKRMNTLFTSNCASITPLMTGEKGFGAPVLSYVDRAGQLAGIDIFGSSTNYNFTVIGSSGSGKSYAMAEFFANYLMFGAKIRIIDVGRSYKDLCSIVGGQNIEFTKPTTNKKGEVTGGICLNFFTNIEIDESTGKIHEDELQTIVPLIGLMAMQSLDPEDSNNDIQIPVITGYITQAVTRAFEKRHRNAGMQDVSDALAAIAAEEKSQGGYQNTILNELVVALYNFANPDGMYYRYFNGQNNLKFHSDFVVIELEELDKNPHLKSVVLAALSHIISTEFFLTKGVKYKILAVDEAWSIMDNKIVMKFLETMARRVRKYKGALGIITQGIGDFSKNDATRAIFDNSAIKIFLSQTDESLQAAKTRGELNLDEGIVNILSTLSSKPPLYSDMLIKNADGVFVVLRLITDRVTHWILTGHKDDVVVLNKIMQEFGVSLLDAKLIKGYSETNNTTVAEEYQSRLQAGKIALLGDEDVIATGEESKQVIEEIKGL